MPQPLREEVVASTAPATGPRAHTGDVAYFWTWAAIDSGLAERLPGAPLAAR